MTAAFSFLGQPCPAELARLLADRLVLREEPGGRHVTRMRTEQQQPVPTFPATTGARS